MATKKAVTGAERKAALLECGAKLAAKHGVKNVTRRMVAQACKVSEPLVTSYMGNNDTAQKAYARHAKKLGLVMPTKEQAEAIGAKLRAHGPRKAPVVRRKRTVKEVEAIKRKSKVAAKKSVTAPVATSAKRAGKSPRKATEAKKPASAVPAVRATAARKPKAPPPLPPLPVADVALPLPPLPVVQA